MRIWSILLIITGLKWCIHLRRSLFFELKIVSKELNISSNDLKISSSDLKISSNELKISSNELKMC